MIRYLLLLILVACSSEPIRQPKPEDLSMHVKYFEALYETHVSIDVKPGQLPWGKLGSSVQCSSTGIVISDIYMMTNPGDDDVEEVVFHELGHCYFGREHIDEIFKSGPMRGCPVSTMISYSSWEHRSCWPRFKEYYVRELGKPGMCIPYYVHGGVCDQHYNSNPKFFPSRKAPMRFNMGDK